jgi:3-dehydroquinate synthetase
VGGKVAVNHPEGKNMIGAFYQPRAVVCDISVLSTLNDTEYLAGLAEIVKYGVIYDEEFFRYLEGNVNAIKSRDFNALKHMIFRSCQIKAEVVGIDEKESGLRAILNYGHTFGHAIEHEARLHGADITHGEAVAMGIVLAAELSERLGLAQKGLSAQLKADFSRLGLPVDCPYPVEDLVEALRKDKKAVAGGKVKFVLLRAPGDVVLQELPYDCYLHTK